MLEAIKTTLGADPTSFVRSDLDKKFAFEESQPTIDSLLNLFGHLDGCDLSTLPVDTFGTLRTAILGTSTTLDTIRKFNPTESYEKRKEPSAAVRDLRDELSKRYQRLYDAAVPLLSLHYAIGACGDIVDVKAERARYEEQISEYEKIKRDHLELLEELRGVAGEEIVMERSSHFRKEAFQHFGWLLVWLGVTATGFWATLGFALDHLETLMGRTLDISLPYSIQLAIAKLVLLSLAYAALAFCGRTFRGHLHNWTVNRHRANCLKSAVAFLKTTDDPATKEAILLHVAQAIFSPQTTGYFSGKESSPVAAIRAPDLLRTISSAGSQG